MRDYLSRLLYFAIVLYIVLFVIDYGYSAMIRASNWRPVEAWEDVVEGNIHADVVAFGSSRGWVQIDPHIIDSVLCVNSYNLGIDGSEINRQVQKYEVFRKRNSKPKLIIQNIDVWSLGYTIGYEREQFFPFFWDKDMRITFFQTEPFSWGEKHIPFFRYHGMNPLLFIHRNPRTLYKGYQGQVGVWNGEAFEQQKSISFHVDDTTIQVFNTFLAQAVEDSVRVVFVYAPLFSGATEKISNRELMYETYQNLADKFGIPVLDYTDMWICRDTAYFYNAMHLNKTGAEIYTDSLANDIKRLGVL